MLHFCTLYNSNYSAKGLAMYYSLKRHCPSFHLYVFAFDDKLVDIINKMHLEHVTVITLKEFEDEDLLRVKPTRSPGEYCWTCSSSTILYCLEHYDIESCTYIDADLYFYSDPSVLIDEMGDNDVLITEHRYSPQYDQTTTSGKYCVQFMTFKNTPNGLKVLKWWRNACIEWCYSRFEDGKFGDQKYLDDWTARFQGIHELKHLGGGVAPWNVQQYSFRKEQNHIVGKELESGKEFPLVFFHFHNYISYAKGRIREDFLSDYELPISCISFIYKDYMKSHRKCFHEIKRIAPDVDGVATRFVENDSLLHWSLRIIKHWIKSLFNPSFKFYPWLEK